MSVRSRSIIGLRLGFGLGLGMEVEEYWDQ